MARKRVKKSDCPNCNFKFSETNNYCPNCGQENHTHKLPIKHFFAEVIEGIFHFDTKVFATLRDLFIPGKLTLNYNQNKKARYIPPVRLYIFISFIFFLLISKSVNFRDDNMKVDLKFKIEKEEDKKLKKKIEKIVHRADSLKNTKDSTEVLLLKQIAESQQPDSLIEAYYAFKKTDLAWYNRHFYYNQIKYKTGHLSQKEIINNFFKSSSYIMFILMPIFALYLYLIYWRKKLFFSEHLIFSIHLHSFIFLILSIWQVFNMFHINIGFVFFLIILIYTFLIFRKVYGQSWIKTILKLNILGFIYSVSLLVIFVIGVVLSVFI